MDITSEWWQRAAARLQCKLDVQEKCRSHGPVKKVGKSQGLIKKLKKDPRGHQDPKGHKNTKGFFQSHIKRLIGFYGCWVSDAMLALPVPPPML